MKKYAIVIATVATASLISSTAATQQKDANPRGTLEARLTVSGDEMWGTALILAGSRIIYFRRVEPATPLAPT